MILHVILLVILRRIIFLISSVLLIVLFTNFTNYDNERYLKSKNRNRDLFKEVTIEISIDLFILVVKYLTRLAIFVIILVVVITIIRVIVLLLEATILVRDITNSIDIISTESSNLRSNSDNSDLTNLAIH
jgi:hypothetical protein